MLPRLDGPDDEAREGGVDAQPPPYGRLEELRPAELAAILRRFPLAFVPSGTLEWHSLHLPVGLDGIVAEQLCLRAAGVCGGVVVPATYWAIGGVPHPFTARIKPGLVEALFVGVLEQLGHMGFRHAFVLAGHYGIDHYTALKRAAVHAMERSGMTVCAMPPFELVTDHGYRGGDHAGAWETSLLWALRPELVDMGRLPAEGPLAGIIGEDPREGASAARGHALATTVVERMARLAAHLVADAVDPLDEARSRSGLLDALSAQVDILEQIRQDRAMRPRVQVRELMSEPYLRYLDHLWRGEYAEARRAAAEARLALALVPSDR